MKILTLLRSCTACALLIISVVYALPASTGRAHEISNIRFENVTQTSVDVLWDTAHPGTSQVLLARSDEYEPERWIPATADPALVTAHRVKVDHLFSGHEYFIYVASVDQKGQMSTAPGPQTVDGKNPMMSMKTRPADSAAAPDFAIYTLGPDEVFAGYDMYFLVQPTVIGGPPANFYIYNQHGYNNSSDGVVKFLGSGKGNPETISAHLSCTWSNATGSDSAEQSLDRVRDLGYCDKSVNKVADVSFRVRTSQETIPGKYSLSFTIENNGVKRTTTYDFNVLPTPTAPPAPQLTNKNIPGLGTWEKQMVELGDKWCAYRDQQNKDGNFVISWGVTSDAWFYDGGRSYENIDSYTAAAGHPNHPHWQHCALSLLEPYAEYLVGNNGAMASYSMFPGGMTMNYWRTHSQLMRDGVKALSNGPHRVHSGQVDPGGIRENAYRSNNWIMDEMLGAPRAPLLQRNIDKLMGNLNMYGNGTAPWGFSFMAGIAMETLIHWYDLNMAEGHPDYRVPPVIKEALDGLWANNWEPKYNLFDYNRFTLPRNSDVRYTALNNMISVGYAWYWMQTGDTTERDRGDLAFQHAFDDPGTVSYSGKQFSQLYEFSFDFVRYRKGEKTSTLAEQNNPFTGPYADTVPPITDKVNCDPNYFPNCKAGSITSTTATIFWVTYKAATTQVIYGKTRFDESSPVDSTMTFEHQVKLTGLQPDTTYHFRVKSVDRGGNVALMHELIFKTPPQ